MRIYIHCSVRILGQALRLHKRCFFIWEWLTIIGWKKWAINCPHWIWAPMARLFIIFCVNESTFCKANCCIGHRQESRTVDSPAKKLRVDIIEINLKGCVITCHLFRCSCKLKALFTAVACSRRVCYVIALRFSCLRLAPCTVITAIGITDIIH